MRVTIASQVLALLFVFASSAFSQSVTIEASKDNTLFEDAAGLTSNGAGDNFFVGKTNQLTGSLRRGLIAFNVAAQVPANATITGVTLTLNMSRSTSGNHPVNLHRVLADWGEGTSNANGNEGGGAPAATNDATWVHRFFSSAVWSSPGAAYVSAASASQSVGAANSYTWGSTADMVSDVQGWLNAPSSNFGWILIGNESVVVTTKRFDTRENPIVANRPKLTVTYTTATSVNETKPEVFALHQNYPNPFNPSTTIEFELSQKSHATLKIFNILGQQVATLVDGVLSAGAHVAQWNASRIPSGIYVCKLESNGSVATRKLILSK